MSHHLMTDFLNLEENGIIDVVTKETHPTKQQSNLVLTPNELSDLTPFGINKVLNKELPVVLEHLLRVRRIAYQIVRYTASSSVLRAIFIVSSKSRTRYRVREDQNSDRLTNFGQYTLRTH